MGKTIVPSVAEMAERIQQRAAGKTPEGIELIRAKERIAELESSVQGLTKTPSLTPADLKKGLDDIFNRHGVEPADEVIKLLTRTDDQGRFLLTPSERVKIWLELLQYRAPKLKSVEHSGTVNSNVQLVVMRFSDGKEIATKNIQLDSQAIDIEVTKNNDKD